MLICDKFEPKTIKKLFPIVRRLKRGDFQILVGDTKLVIERKTLSDLWNSLKSDRLNIQLEHSDILLVEQFYVPKKIDWEKMYDVLNGVAQHHIVLMSAGPRHTKRILDIVEGKLRDGTLGTMRVATVDKTMSDPRIGVLMKFPQIGDDRAKKLLKQYGQLNLTFSSIDAWTEIEGIGKKTVQRVKDFLQDESPIL